ncbi:hypothetical protein HMPREF0454_01094 [Hafnia alvei ATCC 51873]|uniref:Uncharacterized protein n=1 Tax=Hafnia alvei ATCC 51873 TaxID=1002364 RepID=G9Y3K7_HAFAL|nr:hypothetical protein HMPREF0454_01094 [Hafnia alvei ATCC 51873]
MSYSLRLKLSHQLWRSSRTFSAFNVMKAIKRHYHSVLLLM